MTISFDIRLLMAHQRAAVHTRASWAIVAVNALQPPRAAAHEKFIALLNSSAQPMRPLQRCFNLNYHPAAFAAANLKTHSKSVANPYKSSVHKTPHADVHHQP
jgi:hypothetical protein